MTELTINNRAKYTGAECWNELSEKRLLRVAKILFSGKPESETKAALAFAVFGLGGWFFFNLSRFFNNKFFASEIVNKLLPEVQWVTEKNTLTKQIIPQIQIREAAWMETLYGPSSNFENLKMDEFSDAEFCFQAYNQNKDTAWLWRMMACLYRKGDKSLIVSEGDARFKYNFHGNADRERQLKKLPMEYAFAFLLWYNGCRQKLVEEYEFLFDAKTENEEEAKKEAANNAASWVDLIHGMAGDKLGDVDKVKQRTVRQVFFELRRLKETENELKEKYPDVYK